MLSNEPTVCCIYCHENSINMYLYWKMGHHLERRSSASTSSFWPPELCYGRPKTIFPARSYLLDTSYLEYLGTIFYSSSPLKISTHSGIFFSSKAALLIVNGKCHEIQPFKDNLSFSFYPNSLCDIMSNIMAVYCCANGSYLIEFYLKSKLTYKQSSGFSSC